MPLLLCGACSASPARAPRAANVQVAPPAATVAAPRAPAFPRALAVVRADSNFFMYVDGKRLRDAAWFRALMGVGKLVPGFDPVGTVQRRCGFDPRDALTDLAVAGRAQSLLQFEPVFGVGLRRPADDVLACVRGFAPGAAKIRLRGHDALQSGRAALVGADRLIAFGSRDTLASLDLDATPELLPHLVARALAAHTGATLVGAADLTTRDGRLKTVLVVMESDDRHWSLRVQLDTDSPGTAQEIAAAADPEKLDIDPSMLAIAPELHTSVSGTHVAIELSVVGDDQEQARRVSGLVAIAIHSVRHYTARAKIAEARDSIGHIAQNLDVYMHRPGHRLLPPSAPRTPADVPRGKPTRTAYEDWQRGTWQAIEFVMDEPQFYSYEIDTAKDRKSAIIRATGDLDGDGVQSHFTLRVKLDRHGTLHVADSIEEEQPEE